MFCNPGCSSLGALGMSAEPWLVATQSLFTAGTGLSFFAFILFGLAICCPFAKGSHYCIVCLVTVFNILAVLFITIALLVYGDHASGKLFDPETVRTLYYAYYVAWTGDAFLALSFI